MQRISKRSGHACEGSAPEPLRAPRPCPTPVAGGGAGSQFFRFLFSFDEFKHIGSKKCVSYLAHVRKDGARGEFNRVQPYVWRRPCGLKVRGVREVHDHHVKKKSLDTDRAQRRPHRHTQRRCHGQHRRQERTAPSNKAPSRMRLKKLDDGEVSTHTKKRGLAQGCSMSSLIFPLTVHRTVSAVEKQ